MPCSFAAACVPPADVCGIAGVAGFQLDEGTVLDQMGLLRHRGPDAYGIHTGSGAIVAQSRLAIIDLVTGDPPIANEDGRIGVAFNGEIYNFRQLQQELRTAGHDLKTDGDAEVIAHLAEDHDPVALCRRLDGMFAFALWDEGSQRLILGRDRLGKKPLYYWQGHDGALVFGSELKAVLADPRVPRRLAPGAIDAYLAFGYVPTPRTFFEGVLSVPPGHVLIAEPGGRVQVLPHWEPPCRPDLSSMTFEDAGSEVRRLLCDAVDKRLVADVPLGAFLSGGVDSSAVVAFMARLSSRPIKTFTIGFQDAEGYDERPYARQVSQLFATEHTEFVVNPDKAELIERLVWHHDQPFGDSSALPTFLLSELTRSHVTVALSGDGGDELFGGYERFAAALAVDVVGRLPRSVRRASEHATARVPAALFAGRAGSIRRMLRRVDAGLPDALLSWVSYVQPEQRAALLPGRSSWGEQDYARIWSASEGAPLLHRLLLLNLQTYLLDDLLPKMDRMSMACGLEVRSPLLDDALVDFAFRLPPSFKVRGWSLKRVLKEAVRDLLPHEILHRRKRGFGIPLDRWFRDELRPFAEGMLASRSSRSHEVLDPAGVRALLAQHMSGRANHGHAIWTLLTLEVFLRREGW
jgi:asparagine synthase (glutamine-hydrolysing)